MSTSKYFDKIAIVLMCLALVCSLLIALTWTNVESSYAMQPSTNELSSITEYIDLDSRSGEVSILAGGTYYLNGTLNDGWITVDVDDSEYVILILAGVNINCSDGSAIYVANSGNCAIYLEEGTENFVISGEIQSARGSNTKQFEDTDASGGAILLKDNATICGSGSLTVYGYLNNGIHCSNDLFVEGGIISVTAANNGIKGKDNLVIDGGNINISAGNAGLKSGASGNSNSGTIIINGGQIDITESYEGLEANQITINDGVTYIASSDDGINACGGSNSFGGGMGGGGTKQKSLNLREPSQNTGQDNIAMPGGDGSKDGMGGNGDKQGSGLDKAGEKSDRQSMQNNPGTGKDEFEKKEKDKSDNIDFNASPGAIEGSKQNGGSQMKKPEGNTQVSPGDNSPMNAQNDRNIKFESMDKLSIDNATESDDAMPSLTINGGYLYVLAGGDGLDSNGDLIINGGTVIVDGPTNSANGALDSGTENGGKLLVNGGTLIAVGASGMAETPESESSQNSISINANFNANDMIAVSDEYGNIIFEYQAAKSGSSIIFSSDELVIGQVFTICIGENTYDVELTSTVTKSSVSQDIEEHNKVRF